MSACAVRECENTCIVLHFISNSFTLSKRTTLVNNLKTFAITQSPSLSFVQRYHLDSNTSNFAVTVVT